MRRLGYEGTVKLQHQPGEILLVLFDTSLSGLIFVQNLLVDHPFLLRKVRPIVVYPTEDEDGE